MEAIILAGGLGTRLRSRLSDRPKVMAQVGGRPFISFLLDRLIDTGFRRALLSVGHLRQVIIDEFGRNYRGLEIDYVAEESPLGTGGAIRQALAHAKDDNVLVLNGDTYVDADFAKLLAFHLASHRPLTMTVVHVNDTARYGGVVVQNDCVAGFVEKGRVGPGWISAGAYVLNREFPWPTTLGERFSFETELLMPYLDSLLPAAFRCHGYFLDIGIPDDLDRAHRELGSVTRS